MVDNWGYDGGYYEYVVLFTMMMAAAVSAETSVDFY